MTNENPVLCFACGGRCCESYPGLPRPNDFGNTPREVGKMLRLALRDGKWTLDVWTRDEHLPKTYFPRPKAGDDRPSIFNAGWGGPCHLLNGDSCSLPFRERPFGCRDMKPDENYPGDCESETGSKKVYEVEKWIPYQNVLRRILRDSRK